jgi:membrane protease YdiL (CAAX protease family)
LAYVSDAKRVLLNDGKAVRTAQVVSSFFQERGLREKANAASQAWSSFIPGFARKHADPRGNMASSKGFANRGQQNIHTVGSSLRPWAQPGRHHLAANRDDNSDGKMFDFGTVDKSAIEEAEDKIAALKADIQQYTKDEASFTKEIERSAATSRTQTLVNASIERAKLPGEDKDGIFFEPPIANLVTQGVLGWPIWTGGWGAGLLATSQLTNAQDWIIGVLASIPILAISRGIEYSDAAIFADLNVATKNVVLRTFGVKAQPLFALAASIGIALLTSVVEEVLFRGAILPEIAQWAVTNNVVADNDQGILFGLIASSIGFAIGHTNLSELSFDTLSLLGLQLLTGLSFGTSYCITRDLTTPIMAHFLYDLYTFYETHLVVTDQIAYAESAPPPTGSSEAEVRSEKGDNFVNEARRAFLIMDTNRDGLLSAGEFRCAFYAMGFKPKEEKFQKAFRGADKDASGQVDYDEFLWFLLNSDSSYEAAEFNRRYQLLGVRPG